MTDKRCNIDRKSAFTRLFRRGQGDLAVRLRGFTLPELLVFMIVAGVVFLLVMEGFGLFRRYADSRSAEIAKGSEFYDNYHRLAFVAHTADSIAETEGDEALLLFADGQITAAITRSDSLMILSRGEMNDTLFRCLSELKIIRTPDSLTVTLAGNNTNAELRIAFAIEPRKEKIAQQSIEEQEKQYRYEPNEPEKDKDSQRRRAGL